MRGLVGALDEVLAEWQPSELYLPFPSLHQDHIAAYEAGMRAARLSMTEGHWFTPVGLRLRRRRLRHRRSTRPT